MTRRAPSPDTSALPFEPPRRPEPPVQKPGEIGGPKGLEPTRYGDWEVNGRCSDF